MDDTWILTLGLYGNRSTTLLLALHQMRLSDRSSLRSLSFLFVTELYSSRTTLDFLVPAKRRLMVLKPSTL